MKNSINTLKKYLFLFIYLAALGINCGTRDLHCILWESFTASTLKTQILTTGMLGKSLTVCFFFLTLFCFTNEWVQLSYLFVCLIIFCWNTDILGNILQQLQTLVSLPVCYFYLLACLFRDWADYFSEVCFAPHTLWSTKCCSSGSHSIGYAKSHPGKAVVSNVFVLSFSGYPSLLVFTYCWLIAVLFSTVP